MKYLDKVLMIPISIVLLPIPVLTALADRIYHPQASLYWHLKNCLTSWFNSFWSIEK